MTNHPRKGNPGHNIGYTTGNIQGVLFDLDGTLADTAPDLANTLNTLRAENDLAPLAFEIIRPVVSHGATALLRLGFDLDTNAPRFETLRQRFLDIYCMNLADETHIFPGMGELLDAIEHSGMKWGVVTNKPAWLTEPLMARLNLQQRAACIVSGDSTTNRKPHPEPMLHACRQLDILAQNCVYVGDAQRDVEAGRRAGMKTLVALFGYIGNDDDPRHWQADGMVKRPVEILQWILKYNQASGR
jgi:N-acetyl-D-muramate 6-phosphate phosphatase